MANQLQKIAIERTGGGGVGGGEFGDVGDDPKKGGLPPKESKCYGDLFAMVVKMWPGHSVVLVESDTGNSWLRVTDMSGQYVWRVTGSCANGYLKINYSLLQSPGGFQNG